MTAGERWNARYTQDFRPFPDAPAPWLVAHRALLTGGGRALDVACGDGRNALYLAQHGYAVDAVDASDVAVEALRAAAQERDLSITPVVVDLEHEPPPAGPYDVIVTMNFLQRNLFGPLQAALAPGGLLFYETLAQAHVTQLGRSFNPAYLLEDGELLRAFPELDVVEHFEGVAERSGGPRGIGAIVARRPPDGPLGLARTLSLRETMTTAPREPILLTVIGGFLGAGKTTLLNGLLRDAGDRRLAVLVNDFGAINIDAELVQSREGQMVSLKNGCICCGVAGDFIGELALLRDRPEPPAHVVVEASGVADPGQIAVLGDLPGYRRDAAVVVVDAETVRERAADEETAHHVMGQLRAADLLVLNKADLVDAERLAQTRAWLREIAGPSTAIVETSFGAVPIDVVLGVHAPDRPAPPRHDHDHDHGTPHHPRFETWSWSGPEPIGGAGLVEALQALPDGIVRAKGLLHLREDPSNRYVLQVVGRRFSVDADRPWGDDAPASQLVVIGLPGSVDELELDATLARLTTPAPTGAPAIDV